MPCVFCEVLANSELQIYRDEQVTILLDHDPISIGHVLIIPNDHWVDLDEMPTDLINWIFQLAGKYVGLLKKQYQPAGYSIMQNGGVFNDIGHFHLHIFPRFSKEDFGWTYTEKVDPKATDFVGIKQLIQTSLRESLKQ